ncbi:DCD2B protein, partial [Centropus bengalensis]|nr:DCD2B protein [Centropus bengalensis]
MSSWGLARAPPAKNVVVYRNGDPFFPGRKVVVSPRWFLTFEAFLTEVTASVRAPLAVRNLYTARHGHRVAALGHLQDGGQYVAAGSEKFRRLDECLGAGGTLGMAPTGTSPASPSGAACAVQAEGAWLKVCSAGFYCRVFRNGDLLSPPFPLLLPRDARLPWAALLAALTGRAALPSGAVSRLCRLDGTPVSGGEELRAGGYYVAVGSEGFKKLPYLELLAPRDRTPRT